MIVNNQYGNSIQNAIYNETNKSANNSTQVSFAEKLFNSQRNMTSDVKKEDLRPTDTVGIVIRQMRKYGETEKEIIHNGVKVSFQYDDENGGQITIGEDSEDANWTSIKTKSGTVKFDLNDPDSVMKCLDMFSPEERNQILYMFSLEKMSKEAQDEMSEELQQSLDSMGSSIEVKA